MKISLCMITKNEAAYLKHAIDSVKAHVSEIIVVDTGSTDDTVRIAEDAGAKVASFKWEDDFSAARNFALENASGDWILQLDADEEFVAGGGGKLESLAANSRALAFRVHMTDESVGIENTSLIRFFRNIPDIRYKNRIHEVPDLISQPGMLAVDAVLSDVHLIHHGYAPKVVALTGKRERNLRILEKALSEDPLNLSYIYHSGQYFASAGDLETGLVHFEKAFFHKDAYQLPIIFRAYPLTLMHAGRPEQALNALEHGLKLFPTWIELYFLKAVALFSLGRLDEAETAFKDILNNRVRPSDIRPGTFRSDELPVTGGAINALPEYFLSIIYKARGDQESSKRRLSSAAPVLSSDVNMIFFVLAILAAIFPTEAVMAEMDLITSSSPPNVKKHILEMIG